jgi:hypothetical protein
MACDSVAVRDTLVEAVCDPGDKEYDRVVGIVSVNVLKVIDALSLLAVTVVEALVLKVVVTEVLGERDVDSEALEEEEGDADNEGDAVAEVDSD